MSLSRPAFSSGLMRFLLAVCVSSSVFAQSGTTQAGYAIVTVVFGNVNDLQVVETFGMRSGSGGAQASVTPAILTSKSSLLVSVNPSVGRDTALALANPGPSSINIALALEDSGGQPVANRSIVIPANRQSARYVSEIFAGTSALTRSFDGTLTLSSDSPIGLVALRFRGAVFGNLPFANFSPSSAPLPFLIGGAAGGPTAVLLPHFAAGGNWASQIALSNSGFSSMIVRIDLFDQNGFPMTIQLNDQTGSSFTNLQILSGGLLILGTPQPGSGPPVY